MSSNKPLENNGRLFGEYLKIVYLFFFIKIILYPNNLLAVIRLKLNKNVLHLLIDSDFKGVDKHKECQLLDQTNALEITQKIAYFLRPSKPIQIDVVAQVAFFFSLLPLLPWY